MLKWGRVDKIKEDLCFKPYKGNVKIIYILNLQSIHVGFKPYKGNVKMEKEDGEDAVARRFKPYKGNVKISIFYLFGFRKLFQTL